MFRNAVGGLSILSEIKEIPQIKEYAKRRYVYVAQGGIFSYDILICYGDIFKRGLPEINVHYGVSDFHGTDALELLDAKIVKKFIDDWFNHNSPSDERALIKCLLKINEIGKDKMLEGIVDELLKC